MRSDIKNQNRIFILIFILATLIFIPACSQLNSFLERKPNINQEELLASALGDLYTYQDESGAEKVETVLQVNSENAYVLALRSAFKLHQDDESGALEDANSALDINSETALANAIRAMYYATNRGRYKTAYIEAKKAVDIDPQLSYAVTASGQVAVYREEFESAESLLKEAIEIEPNNIDAYHGLCRVYLNLEDYELALTNINQAIAINPNLDFLYQCKGYSDYSSGYFDEAIADFTEAINLGTDDYYAYWYRAWLYSYHGDNEAALQDYLMAIELNPDDAFVYNGAAYSMALLNQDLDKALEYIQISLELQPDSNAPINTKAYILYQMGNYNDALGLFTELIRTGYTYAYYGRGKVYYEIENFEVAKSDFQNFLQTNSDSPQCDEVRQLLESLE
jgi:tetratricopeptide (TPR) repeat protein